MKIKKQYVYLLHFDKPYKHAQHYIGYTTNLKKRIEAHRNGTSGATLPKVFFDNGIGFTVAKVWRNKDRKFERKLKDRGGASRICPICKQEKMNES